MVSQGEVFASCGCVYLQPAHVTSLLKPLVDHRLDREWALPRAYEYTVPMQQLEPRTSLAPICAHQSVVRALVWAGRAIRGGTERAAASLPR